MNIQLKPKTPPKIVELIGEGNVISHAVLENGETVPASEVTLEQWKVAGFVSKPVTTH